MNFVSTLIRTTARPVLFLALLFASVSFFLTYWGTGFLHKSASAQAAVTVVNAASFANDAQRALTPDTIAAAFGAFVTLNNQVYTASSTPLPTSLGGMRATINNQDVGLFFVSTQQINLLVPANILDGDATIVVTNSDNTTRTGTFRVVRGAPGIFSARFNGQGAAAAVTTTDGVNFLPVANPDGSERDVSAGTSQAANFLVLFTTGIRYTPAANPMDGNGVAEAVTVKIQGVPARVDFAGPAPGLIGSDQLNVVIPPELSGFGSVRISVTTNGRTSNEVTMKLAGDFPPVRLTQINLGETKTGQLTASDQVQPGASGSTFFFDAYDFTTTAANTPIAIDMRSTQFNPGVILYRVESNNNLTQVGADDDFGGMGNGDFVNDNSLLINVIPTPGRYVIFATSSDLQPNGVGDYSLTLLNITAQQINYGQSLSSVSIDATDLKTSAGDLLDIFWFNGTSNDNTRINMNSGTFDSFLFLQSNDNEFFAFDDNSGGGNNAQLTSRLTKTQIHLIVATPFAPNVTGPYTLSLNRLTALADGGNVESDLLKAPGRYTRSEGNKGRLGFGRPGRSRIVEQ